MSSSLNIILFGETGVGKSSLINLIAGRHIAQTSPDVQGCTMSYKAFHFSVKGRSFYIWDTVGIEESDVGGSDNYPAVIGQAYELISHLASQGGVDLLLFCIRGNRVTETAQRNYRLFYEVLCRSSVPIALVITHLEREVKMEKWWERNMESLEKYGIRAAGHACVTGLPTDSKYRESQQNITKLLEGQISDRRFSMPPEKWIIEFLRLFGLFAPLKKGARRKDIMRVLTKRCKLDAVMAEELATKLEGGL